MLDEHQIQIRVRYCETDPMGYLHHANYFVYFEMGRTELLRAQQGNYREMEEQGLFMVVVGLECRFRAPARYDARTALACGLDPGLTQCSRRRVPEAAKLRPLPNNALFSRKCGWP